MNQSELLAYTYDFTSMLLEDNKIKNNLKNIILFGSIARGDFDNESDVDLFIEVKKPIKETEELIKEVINRFELISEKTWNLKGINLPIKVIVAQEDSTWESLKDEIKHYGILIYGKYSDKKENYALVSYSLNKIEQNKKMNFLRKLYGYKIKKNKKVYEKKGIASLTNAVKTASNQIMVKIEKLNEILQVLKEFKLPHKIIKIKFANSSASRLHSANL